MNIWFSLKNYNKFLGEYTFAADNFENAKVELTTLSDYKHLINQALKTDYITASEKETLQNWSDNPSAWKK